MESIVIVLACLLTVPQGTPGIVPGTPCVEVRQFSDLPHRIMGQVGFLATDRVAEIGDPFNDSGASDSKLPSDRFFGACHADDDRWIVAIERGGRERTILLLSFDGFFFLGSRQLPIRPSFRQALESLPDSQDDGP